MTEEFLKCKVGFLGNAEGSSCLTQGNTTISVSIVGPFEPKASKSMYDRATVDLTLRRKGGTIDVFDKMIEEFLHLTCEKAIILEQYPRTSIQITVQEMQDRGNLLSACLNALCMALMNSGIAMNNLFAAVPCAIDECEEIIVNPNRYQISSAVAYFTLVFANSDTIKLLTSNTAGEFSVSTYNRCLEKCFAASGEVFTFYENVMNQKNNT